jgi:hypothetical protein
VIYISEKYRTASHLCACGCGEKVVTPISGANWQLTKTDGCVSLHPSIGNWNYACQSHYWIRRNKVIWSGQMSAARIARVQERDRKDRIYQVEKRNQVKQEKAHALPAQSATPKENAPSWWAKLWAGIKEFLQGR